MVMERVLNEFVAHAGLHLPDKRALFVLEAYHTEDAYGGKLY